MEVPQPQRKKLNYSCTTSRKPSDQKVAGCLQLTLHGGEVPPLRSSVAAMPPSPQQAWLPSLPLLLAALGLAAVTGAEASPALAAALHQTRAEAAPRPAHRTARSGGFPKFPGVPGTLAGGAVAGAGGGGGGAPGTAAGERVGAQCGTRVIPHLPSRPGTPASRIVGGSQPPYGAYPWQVEIQAFRAELRAFQHHCGGALIGPRLVLTAAHCLKAPALSSPDQLRIVLGDHNLSSSDQHEQAFRAERVLLHPEFRKEGPYSNDIALILVTPVGGRAFRFSSHVQPICLPDLAAKRAAPEGSWCTVTGWGAQADDAVDTLSPVLRAAAVPLLTQV
ncbi:Ovochymase-2 [Frankliniella fusca]|uniref:Ovochymase-2 n=1 Tax=Frankliniella fusca TaxID=407009 RepID=A0AAE1H534_9NEOP|nr:Ovochymase-2 [Frankliniella fusca]